ncbi:ATP-binding protein [Planomonospora corallina]|uniref:ATP-binding protein n=1 Tax=Planomonospora corallina TaxID=1806052 RepID=A0ABV8I0I8_9ACTN
MEADLFVGRRTELAEICGLLARTRRVTLIGPAGSGKSRLALRLAGTLGQDSPGYVRVADLSEAPDDLPGLARTLAGVLGARVRPGASAVDAVTVELLSRPRLLVLDDCDRVAGAAGALVERLLHQVGDLRVLATGRQRLGFTGEHLYPIGGLPDDDAADLLAALAGDRLGGRDPVEICRRLDNLPLAIRLAAASPDPGGARLFPDGSLVDGSSPDGPRGDGEARRHGSMGAALDWSHELCDPAERLVWARASVFAGSFDAGAAQHVCGPGLSTGQVLDALSGLFDRSVLTREKAAGGVRLRLTNTARAYGAARLDLLGETAEAELRHRDHFFGLAVRANEGWRNDQLGWYRRLVPDLANLRRAVDHCYADPAGRRRGLELVSCLWFLWVCCGRTALGRELILRGLELEPAPCPERFKALWVHTYMSIQRGEYDEAERALAECAAVDRDGAGEMAPYVSHFQAHLAVARGDLGSALRLIKEARERHRSAGDLLPGFLSTYTVVAVGLLLAGHHDQAVVVVREGRELCASCRDYWTLAHLDLILGLVEHLLGNTAAATASVREALRGARVFDDDPALVTGLEVLAVIAAGDVDDTLALFLLGAARAAWESTGAPPRRLPLLDGILAGAEARLRARTDTDEYDRLIETGRATDLRTAVECALQGVIG